MCGTGRALALFPLGAAQHAGAGVSIPCGIAPGLRPQGSLLTRYRGASASQGAEHRGLVTGFAPFGEGPQESGQRSDSSRTGTCALPRPRERSPRGPGSSRPGAGTRRGRSAPRTPRRGLWGRSRDGVRPRLGRALSIGLPRRPGPRGAEWPRARPPRRPPQPPPRAAYPRSRGPGSRAAIFADHPPWTRRRRTPGPPRRSQPAAGPGTHAQPAGARV